MESAPALTDAQAAIAVDLGTEAEWGSYVHAAQALPPRPTLESLRELHRAATAFFQAEERATAYLDLLAAYDAPAFVSYRAETVTAVLLAAARHGRELRQLVAGLPPEARSDAGDLWEWGRGVPRFSSMARWLVEAGHAEALEKVEAEWRLSGMRLSWGFDEPEVEDER